ncbi:MAG: LamG-like jellyroll fold domain-containing protein, partial [Verrucomicrobiota bacterium]
PEWAANGKAYAEGDPLAPGELELESGIVQLEFFSGASVVLEGPARLRLDSAWKIECFEGKLKTFVPEPAQGFTIVTPDYKAVDLGTEFALSVASDGSSEVHVVDGEVRLDDADGVALTHLHGGDGIFSRDGNLERTESTGDQFIGRENLQGLAAESRAPRLREWRSMRDRLASDPDTLIFFDFESQEIWDRHLENRNTSGPGGAIIGARWTEGRWPGKGALEFKRITDRIRLNLPGEFDALTYAAWIRVEGFDRWLSSLMLTDGFDEGEVHWQISDTGEIVTGIKTARRSPNSTSPPVIRHEDMGSWIHVAATFDTQNHSVVHYLNGEVVLRDRRDDLEVFRVGEAEIGNWTPAEAGTNPIRSLNGRIDEFLLMGRALSEEEVDEIYKAGR